MKRRHSALVSYQTSVAALYWPEAFPATSSASSYRWKNRKQRRLRFSSSTVCSQSSAPGTNSPSAVSPYSCRPMYRSSPCRNVQPALPCTAAPSAVSVACSAARIVLRAVSPPFVSWLPVIVCTGAWRYWSRSAA